MSRRSIAYSSSPLLASKTPPGRSKAIVGLMALGFVVMAGRAAYVQVLGNDFFLRQGEVRYARTLELPASRGQVLDRNGVILATSVVAQSIWVEPSDIELDDPKLGQAAELLGLSLAEFKQRISKGGKSFVWIQRQVDEPVALKVKALGIKGLHLREEYKRHYPEGESAAHVVGFTNVEDLGQEGIELAFNQALSGKAGSRRVIKDRLGRVVEDTREAIPPVNGRDLQLSIDSKIQYFAYQKLRDQVIAHKARAGSVVVLDARSGELLALANYPSYNPNQRQNLTGEQLRNRALTDTFEPGSTMKPFTIGLALESGRVKPETLVQTAPGRLTITGSTISDTHNYGTLTVEGVIQKSSNVGTTKLAMQMQPREMWETFTAAGFGQKPQLEFPGVVGGRVRPYKTWRPIEQATMSYGYGLSASLFQMARSYTVFSNEGRIIPATILKKPEPAVGVQVFSPRTAAQVLKMLAMATGPGGTGQRAQTIGYSVGGKSGTARKQAGKGYAAGKYRAWFTGMAPIEHPRIICAVMLDEPSAGQVYGGLVAAPVFSETVQQALRILGEQPDMSVKPHIVAQAVEESL
ncbi:MAG: penicillin-binding protein 2 [Burkholderiales bacterium]|nr:penicillin-binding protein 2 [Burkholderiales bacterium]